MPCLLFSCVFLIDLNFQDPAPILPNNTPFCKKYINCRCVCIRGVVGNSLMCDKITKADSSCDNIYVPGLFLYCDINIQQWPFVVMGRLRNVVETV